MKVLFLIRVVGSFKTVRRKDLGGGDSLVERIKILEPNPNAEDVEVWSP